MNGPLAPLRRSDFFLARAMDRGLQPLARKAAYFAYEAEAWFEAVDLRKFPIMALPKEYMTCVVALLRQRYREPLSGTRIRL